MAHPDSTERPTAAWPLALLAGGLPLVATLVAYPLSVRLGLVEACNPFVDGCISISRAARHDLPNHIFRALMLPAAALQALCWLMCGAWLRSLGAAPTRQLRALPWVGLVGALFLIVYGTFLGTEGEAYRWARRYGVVFYFGGTCIAMLIVSGATQRLGLRASFTAHALVALCIALPLLGLVNVVAAPLLGWSDASRAAAQNITEWWGALIFTIFFFALAWLWRTTGFEMRLGTRADSVRTPTR